MDRFAALIRKIFQGHLAELNIWDRELTRDEVQAMSSCQDFPQGNVVAWRTENFKLVGLDRNVGIRNIEDMATFCKRKSFFVFPAQKRDLQSAHKQCQAMGGEIAVPEGEEENSEIMDLVRTHSTCLENPNSIAWIGIEKKSEYPQWIYVNPTDIAMDAVR